MKIRTVFLPLLSLACASLDAAGWAHLFIVGEWK